MNPDFTQHSQQLQQGLIWHQLQLLQKQLQQGLIWQWLQLMQQWLQQSCTNREYNFIVNARYTDGAAK